MLRWTGVQDIGWRGCTVCVIGVEPTFDRRGCDVEDFEVEELEEVMRKYCAIGGVCKIDIVELFRAVRVVLCKVMVSTYRVSVVQRPLLL